MPCVTGNEENVALAAPRRFCTSATAWDVNEPPAVEPAVQTEASVEPTLVSTPGNEPTTTALAAEEIEAHAKAKGGSDKRRLM